MKNEKKYTKFALVREMMEVPGIIRDFKPEGLDSIIEETKQVSKLILTGEGSSRIFPAKNAINYTRRRGIDIDIITEGSYQSAEYDLSEYVVFAASNSGRTKETISLFSKLKGSGHRRLFSLTANKNTKLEELSKKTFILSCGNEDAIAATKSCIEQGLFYQSLLAKVQGESFESKLAVLAKTFEHALTMEIDPAIVKAVADAQTVYVVGRNDGVAEELAVKVNEIVRKKSCFLEGTSYMHGAQEVMNAGDVVMLIEPFALEFEKTKDVLEGEVGLKIFAIAGHDTIFPTVVVEAVKGLAGFVYLAAGWNVLVEAGISLDINLDQTERARKVGNVFEEQSG